jgi:hypothetical protein
MSRSGGAGGGGAGRRGRWHRIRGRGPRRRLWSFALILPLLAAPSPALAASTGSTPTQIPTPTATPGGARLQGTFLLAGKVTVADNIRGEHVGEMVLRAWTFTPRCAAGACRTVTLVRRRSSGSDRLLLSLRGPGYYVGSGSFYAPLRCGSRTYSKGEAAPFTITVRVTAAAISAGAIVATRVRASYMNRSRTNLTPCVAPPGDDAASYHGHLAAPPPPT